MSCCLTTWKAHKLHVSNFSISALSTKHWPQKQSCWYVPRLLPRTETAFINLPASLVCWVMRFCNYYVFFSPHLPSTDIISDVNIKNSLQFQPFFSERSGHENLSKSCFTCQKYNRWLIYYIQIRKGEEMNRADWEKLLSSLHPQEKLLARHLLNSQQIFFTFSRVKWLTKLSQKTKQKSKVYYGVGFLMN